MQPSILIVEDDVTFSLMLKTWLGRKGFLVESQTSVSDAQKCLDSRSFQLVLSDLRLPDRDGIELLKWLNSERQSPIYAISCFPVPVLPMDCFQIWWEIP